MLLQLATRLLLCLVLAGCAAQPQEDPEWIEVKQWVRSEFPGVSQVGVDGLQTWLAAPKSDRPVLLDVRAADEFAVSHIADARYAPDADAALAALAGEPHDRRIVVYCSVGYRSSRLAEELVGAGFTNVHNLEGSIFEWANRGLPLVDADGPTHGVHPYDEEWGRHLDADLWRGLSSEE